MTKSTKNLIQGAKGGDTPRTPVEQNDTLRSVALARILDLVSEGEIAGWATTDHPMRDIYLDETPVENPDGTLNFKNIQIDYRYGTQNQDHIAGFPSVENEIAASVELKTDAEFVRSLTNTNLNAVRVRLSVPALSKTDTKTGDVTGYKVEYAIDIKVGTGAYIEALRSSFDGKTMAKYERSHRIDLPPLGGAASWTLRVRRITPATSTQAIQSLTFVESYTEIIDARFRYPMSALVGITLDASQFQNIPTRAYDLKGRIVRVPSNYNATTRAYSGIWDGTFQLAWTDNPAWCFYDLVTHPRYGLGHLISDAQVNKWALYKIAQYCDELVPNGFGGTEPRFTCNLFLQSQAEAYKIIQDMSSIFRGMSYWANGEIMAVADKPEDPVYTYTPANVLEGKFTYQGSPRKTRYTVALVSWSDPKDFGRAKVEYVQDEEGVARYGVQQTDVIAIGCDSQGQAQRLGRYMLVTSRYETNTVSFAVGLDGTFCAPGQIIRIADPLRAGARMGGRITSMDLGKTVTVIDSLPSVAPVVGDSLTVIMPSGVAETRTISAISGTSLTVSPAFSAQAVVGAVWAVDKSALNTQRYRVVSVAEGEGMIFNITAVEHNVSKFSAVDNGTVIDVPQTSMVPAPTQVPPTNIQIGGFEVAGAVVAQTVASISWTKAAGAVMYDVQYRKDNGTWINLGRTSNVSIDAPGITSGTYTARVRAINAIGIMSQPADSLPTDIADQMTRPDFAGVLAAQITKAMLEAVNISGTADGKITAYLQTAAPTIGLFEGDVWIDTDANNATYRRMSGGWVSKPRDLMSLIILAASEKESISDGKVTMLFQMGEPTGDYELGDLWFDTFNAKLYRWNGFNWTQNLNDFTTNQLGGNGVNVLWDEYSRFTGPLPPMGTPVNGTVTKDTATYFFSEGSLKMVSTAANMYAEFGTTRDIPIDVGRKYIFSVYVKSSRASATIRASLSDGTQHVQNLTTASVVPNVWTRVSCVFNTAGYVDNCVRLRLYNDPNTGVTTYFDGLMLEPVVGNLTKPSPFCSGVAGKLALASIIAAAQAKAIADGSIDSYFQPDMPATGSYGDIWFDTNDGNKQYVHDGVTYVVATDQRIGDAIVLAAGAQATADNKIRTFYSTSTPTMAPDNIPLGIGDLWVETDNGNRLRRWNGFVWTDIASASVVSTLEVVAGVLTIDCLYADQFIVELDQNVTSVVFKNVAESTVLILQINQHGDYTIKWPNSVSYPSGIKYVVTTGDGTIDMVGLLTNNAGDTWQLVATQPTPIAGSPLVVTTTPLTTVSASASGAAGASVTATTIDVVAAATGGVSPYTFEWTRNDKGTSPSFILSDAASATTNFRRTSTVSSIVSQQWRVTATDAEGQVASKTINVNLKTTNVSPPAGGGAALSATFSPSNPYNFATYPDPPTATVTVTATGGVAPYTYAWTRPSPGVAPDTGGNDYKHPDSTNRIQSFSRFSGTLAKTTTQTWQCDVTDSTGAKVSVSMNIELESSGNYAGGIDP